MAYSNWIERFKYLNDDKINSFILEDYFGTAFHRQIEIPNNGTFCKVKSDTDFLFFFFNRNDFFFELNSCKVFFNSKEIEEAKEIKKHLVHFDYIQGTIYSNREFLIEIFKGSNELDFNTAKSTMESVLNKLTVNHFNILNNFF